MLNFILFVQEIYIFSEIHEQIRCWDRAYPTKQTRRIAGGLAGARADGPASRPVSGLVASGQDTQAEWPASWVAGWLVTRVTVESQSSDSRVTVES